MRISIRRVAMVIGLSALLSANSVLAQDQPLNLKVDQLMQEAVDQMNKGAYEQANLTFREILDLNTVMPTELTYLFAETLYMIHQYHNSRNFLDKYLRLAGTTGRYYPQALDLKQYLDDEFQAILRCSYCNNQGYRLIPCETCDQHGHLVDDCYYCLAVGITMCEVCKGNGVTTSLNAFNEVQYFTCPNCQGKGQVTCKICQGKKITSEPCPDCHGTLLKPGAELCDHQDPEGHQN